MLSHKLVMKYLHQHHYIESLVALQRQSDTNYHQYARQVQFFRKIILKGDFTEAAKFLKTFQSKISPKDLKKIILELYKQKLYEMIENPDENELKQLFEKELINICTEQQYQNLFTCLTCRSAQDLPGMKNWTITKGRINCFQQILPYLENIISIAEAKDEFEYNLEDIVEYFQKQYLSKQNKKEFTEPSMLRKTMNHPDSRVKQDNANSSRVGQNSVRNSRNNDDGAFNFNYIRQKIQNNLRSSTSSNAAIKSAKNLTTIPQLPKLTQLELSESQYDKNTKSPKLYTNQSANKLLNSKQIEVNLKKLQQANKKKQKLKINAYESSQKSQTQQQDKYNQSIPLNQSRNFRKHKKNLLTGNVSTYNRQQKFQSSQNQQLDYQTKKSIAYLQQSNSVVEKDLSQQYQNFTFSHHQDQIKFSKNFKITKLGVITDSKAIRTCQYSQSGRYFAIGTNSSLLKIFNVQQLYQKNIPKGSLSPIYQIDHLHEKSIFCLNWSNKQNSLLTCSNDLTIILTKFGSSFRNHQSNIVGRHQSCIRMVKFNADQTKVISCGDDSLIKIWDLGGKLKKSQNLIGHKQSVSAFKFSDDQQNILYSVSKDETIKRWDMRVSRLVGSSKSHKSQITYIANNTNKIVISDKNGIVSFYDPSTLQIQQSNKIHVQQIRSIDSHLTQKIFLTTSFDGNLGIFSQKTFTSPLMYRHNEINEDKVVFATFIQSQVISGFASSSTLGFCHLYSYE